MKKKRQIDVSRGKLCMDASPKMMWKHHSVFIVDLEGLFSSGYVYHPPSDYGCSFVAKLENVFLKKENVFVFTKYILIICRKNYFYTKQKFYAEKNYYWEAFVKKYASFEKSVFLQKIYVTNKNV